MQLEAKLPHTLRFCELRHLTPERDNTLAPLPLQQLQEILRPCGHHPIRIPAAIRRTWAAAHTDDPFDAKQPRQLQCLASDLDRLGGQFLFRMKRIPAAVERRKL